MRLGDLGQPLAEEHGQPDQALPFGESSPADIVSGANALAGYQQAPTGEPNKNVYTVSVYDSRPPNAIDVIKDSIVTITPLPP